MKINPWIFFFILLLFFMFLGAMNPLLTFFSVIFCALVAFLISAYFSSCESRSCCEGCALLLAMQNFSIGLGAHLTSNYDPSLKYLTQIPFMTIALIWIGVAVNAGNAPGSPHTRKSRKAFSIFAFTIALSLLIGRGNAQSILITVRNLTVFYMAYEIGYRHLSKKNFLSFQRFFLILSAFMLMMGVILLIGGLPLYKAIGIVEVFVAKSGKILFQTGFIGEFYTDFLGMIIQRMGSLYYEPVNLGYFFSTSILIAYFGTYTKQPHMRLCVTVMSALSLLLCFGKGGILLTFVVFLCVFSYRILLRLFPAASRKKICFISLAGWLSAIALLLFYYYTHIGGAVNNHFYGIAQGWRSALHRPFGYGLGTGGNMAAVFGVSINQGWLGSGGESALITYLFQLGFQGVLALTLCMKRLAAPFNKRYDPKWLHPFHFLPLILLFVSIFQENTFTPQCIVPFMFLQGGAVRNWESELKDKERITLYVLSCT